MSEIRKKPISSNNTNARIGVVNQQMAKETWIAPILDFFKRYGVKLALVLL
jgi:hypothetical protein